MVAMTTVVHELHVGTIVFDVYDLIFSIFGLGALVLGTLDVLHARQAWVKLQVWVDVLRVLCVVVDLVVVHDANTVALVHDCVFVSTGLAVVYESLFFIDVDIQHIIAMLTKPHLE